MEFISSWVQGIIVSVVIATIIEMILPEGNSKKYIKIVIGVYVVFNIVAPILNKFTKNKFDFTDILNKYNDEISAYEINSNKIENNNETYIKEVYLLNLKNDMKSKIQDKGFIVNSIYIELEKTEEYKVKNLNLSISKKVDNNKSSSINTINNVEIQVNIDNTINETEHLVNINTNEIKEIKDYINSIYEINNNIIHINE